VTRWLSAGPPRASRGVSHQTSGAAAERWRDTRARLAPARGRGRALLAPVAAICLGLVLLLAGAAGAVPVGELDPAREWRLRRLRFEGNEAVTTRTLRRTILTQPRPWYTPWRALAVFDPTTFETDIERLRALYRVRGHYLVVIDHDLEELERTAGAEGPGDLAAVISIQEGPAVRVEAVTLTIAGVALEPADEAALRAGLPLRAGEPFTEEAYNAAVTYLRGFYRERGHGRVSVTKRAEVDVARDAATVAYAVDSGPSCVFGTVRIEGTKRVDPEVIRRELAFSPGAPFKESEIEATRGNLLALKLFRSVRFEEGGAGERVDIVVRVQEQAFREIRIGVGFDSEELLRGTAGWRHLNFLGGARQLGVRVRASQLERTISAGFLQPHFPTPRSRSSLNFSLGQETEEPYTLDRTQVSPRVDWQATRTMSVFALHRLEFLALSEVDTAIERTFPGIAPSDGTLSGLTLGVEWNTLDDPIDPHRGWTSRAQAEPVGGILGGDFSFVRLTWDGRLYWPLYRRLRAAARVRLGAAEPLGSSSVRYTPLGTPVRSTTDEIPIFERFFSGGTNSVRGYQRWRVGPILAGDPVGGRTQAELSIELLHPVTKWLDGAVFLDAGQVSVRSWDFPFDDLKLGAGLGVRIKSPIGPLRVDVGFPNRPPGDDGWWQLHFSFGSTF
jgi:outer membrane protein assembly complex protein YaeT